MNFKKLYEQLILGLRSLNTDRYTLVPKKELQSIDFILGGSPRQYKGIKREVGTHSTILITIGSVHSFFGNIAQIQIGRTMHFSDFQKSKSSHNFEYKDGIFNIYNQQADLKSIAQKIDAEINRYEYQSTLKFTPSKALAKIVGISPLDKLSVWDLLSTYVTSNKLVVKNSKIVHLDKPLEDIFGNWPNSIISADEIKEILEEHLIGTPPF